MSTLRARQAPFLAALTLWTLNGGHAQTAGAVREVHVYRGQALVSRSVSFEATGGMQDVVVTELPAQIVPASLYAVGDENTVIRAVRMRTKAVLDEPREEVRQLDTQIAGVERELEQIQSDLKVIAQQQEFLDKLEAFAAPAALTDTSRGVLNTEALIALARFQFEQRRELATSAIEANRKLKDASERLAVLQRDRAKLTAGENRTLREAVVSVECRAARTSELQLSYLVNGVGWAPAYIARLNDAHDRLTLEYHAVVTQTSGEDWNNVSLTLSTSYPNMVADPPTLSPLWISLAAMGEESLAERDAKDYSLRRRALETQIREQQANRPPEPADRAPQGPGAADGMPGRAGGGFGGMVLPADDMNLAMLEANILAAQLQNLELSAADEVITGARRSGETGALAAEYEMPGQVSLQSRDDPQMLRITGIDLAAKFSYTAVPLLSDYVFQAVEATNTSDVPLLAGPYNAYVGRAFAGRGALPMTARGQSLRIGFGTETGLRVSRTLESKQTDIRGGNKLLNYHYRVRLENFMDQPATVRVWDRLPQPPDNQVTVTLVDHGPPLSSDPWYVEQERPRGLLRWDIEVPAKAAKTDAYSFTYRFQLEFDKNYTVGELPPEALQRIRRDFETLMELKAH